MISFQNKNDKSIEEWIIKVKNGIFCLCGAPDIIRNNKIVILAAVEKNGGALEFASY